MKLLKDESLAVHTTIRVGGVAQNYYIPESIEELIQIVREKQKCYVLSAGSNLLINDQKKFENVISMKSVDNTIQNQGEGKFYCGASVYIQRLIKMINSQGYGGIEELYSIPAMVGGMIYMNASVGNDIIGISDYLTCVHIIDNGERRILKKDECCFLHRKSIFQKKDYIIVGAEFNFIKQEKAVSKSRIEKRLSESKLKLDHSGHNFGSVFSQCNYKLMGRLTRIPIRIGNARLSSKTPNWILCEGEATYKSILRIITICKIFHKICLSKCELEVQVWK